MRIKRIKDKLPESFVDIHKEAFKGFFLTTLGDRFLLLYYSSVLKSCDGLLVCIFDEENKLVGFAAGTCYSGGFHKKILLKNIISFTWVLFNIVLFRPKAILRLFKNMNKSNKNLIDDGNYAELLSIAVSSKCKDMGYGKLLLQAFESELEIYNVKKISLTTDYYNNEDTLAFYKKRGYEIFYDFKAFPNRRMYKLIKKCNNLSPLSILK